MSGSIRSWIGRTFGLTTTGFWSLWAGRDNASGETVTSSSAMSIASFNRGVRLEAETIGSLPFNVYTQSADRKTSTFVAGDNYLDGVVRVSPNDDQTPNEFWEAMVAGMRVDGNSYALKQRLGGRLVALQQPRDCEPYRRTTDNALRYRGVDKAGERFDLDKADVFHLKGFNFGGDLGLSTIEFAAQSLGTIQAGNKAAARVLASGLSGGGFIKLPGSVEEDDRGEFQKNIDAFARSTNPAKMFLLEGGADFVRTSLSAADSQLMAQMGFGIEEVARWLGMPPVLLGHNPSGQTMWGTGVEAIIQAWYTLGLRAQLTRIERAINKRLVEPKDRATLFVKINVDALMRGDSAAQAALFSAAAQNGWLSRNEIRKLLDLEPMDGGDDLTVQVNMTLLKNLGSQQQDVAREARVALRALIGVDEEPARPMKRAA